MGLGTDESKAPSLCIPVVRGEAEVGENCSPERGEVKPERGRLAGDVEVEEQTGPAGSREEPMSGMGSDFCCGVVWASDWIVLNARFVAWSFCS